MNKFISSALLLTVVSCATVEKTTSSNKKIVNLNKTQIDITIDPTPENLITQDTIQTYDLTVLKGGFYPKIINDSPFTDLELKILKNSEGLEIEANAEIAHYFKYFLRDKHDLMEAWVENSRNYIPEIKEQFRQAGLPEELIYLPFLESGYNVQAYSRVGAGGIWQFMPKTAQSYGLRINWWIDERRSPQLATPYAIKHLNYLYNLFDDWYIALASYNAGEGRLSRAMKKADVYNYFDLIKTSVLPQETRKYVPQFMAVVKIMKNLEVLGFTPINWDYNTNLSKIDIPGGLDITLLLKTLKITWSDFNILNPAFRRKVSDPEYSAIAYIPMDKLEIAKKYLQSAKPLTHNGYNYYTVKSGDSWWFLSKLTNTTISSLKRLNNVNSNSLKIGQRLLLPGIDSPVAKSSTESPQRQELEIYTVRNGDTISSISIRYNIKLNSLYIENSLNAYSILKIGQIIKLPGYPIQKNKIKTTSYYTVKNGDSIWLISQEMQIPYKTLLSINNLNSNSKLKIGDKILLY